MKEKQARLAYLLDVYGAKKATSAELEELFTLIENDPDSALKDHLSFLLQSYDKTKTDLPDVDWYSLYQEIIRKKNLSTSPILHLDKGQDSSSVKQRDPSRLTLRPTLLKWSAAAILILFIGISALYFTEKKNHPGTHSSKEVQTSGVAAPGSIHATLTLSDGRRILIGSADSGLMATEGSVRIKKDPNGGLVYSGNNNMPSINTLSNPSGSKVLQLILDDGTKVWLNAASTLTFPTSFPKGKRQVSLDGEGYFEVAHNSSKPFFVQNGNVSVQVLGTHFNVSAYNDERAIKVTLLEGLINVKKGSMHQLVKPGQQAVIDNLSGSGISIKKDIDLNEAMGWYKGKFTFKDQDIRTIMRQVSRWYNVDIEYQGKVYERFYVDVSRNTNVDTLLKMLEATNAVHFKLKNKKITVMKTTQ